MRVREVGKGIDPAVLAGQGIQGHYGLRGMPERAALLGGIGGGIRIAALRRALDARG